MKKSLSFLIYKCVVIACALVGSSHGPLVLAAEAGKNSVQGYLLLIMLFINAVIIPLFFGIALLFFLVNIVRFFILGAHESEGRDKARKLALYGIGAFVFLLSLWGIINMLVGGFGFDRDESICPDYLEKWCTGGYDYYGSGSEDYMYYTPKSDPGSDDDIDIFYR